MPIYLIPRVTFQIAEVEMKKQDPWSRRAGQTISILYLLMFMLSEAYSAAATALERKPRFPSWEHLLGWAIFALPGALLASLFLFHWKHPRLGFWIVCGNLCLYASFMVFEAVAFGGIPASSWAMWEVGAIWTVLFFAALLAARYLATWAQTKV